MKYVCLHIFPHTIVTKHIIHLGSFAQYKFKCFCLVYHVISLDGKWVHGTCQGEEVCNVQRLVEDIIWCQLFGQ